MNTTRILAVAVLIVASGLALHAAQAQQPGIKRTDLQRHDLGVPGREVVQVRVDFTPGVGFPKHSHPGEEIVYVIEGLLEYEVEGKPPMTLKAGEVLFIPAGTVHAARNVGSGNAAELAGQTIVVIGGSSGSGLETARRARKGPCSSWAAPVASTRRRDSRSTKLTIDLGGRMGGKTWQIPFWSPARRAASAGWGARSPNCY